MPEAYLLTSRGYRRYNSSRYLDIEIINKLYREAGMWDPAQYLRFSDHRSRPFFDLTSRVLADRPGLVVDLGCGPGHLSVALAERWPEAEVQGIDSDPEMIASARRLDAPPRVSFACGDLRDWQPARPPDVIVSNAVLQWVPGHQDLMIQWAAALAPGGYLAVQLPGNHDAPSQAIIRELAASYRWRAALAGVQLNQQASDPAGYADRLARAGCAVDAWETTYLHLLAGPDAVLEWFKGSALRPVLAALEPADAAEFTAEYGARLRAAYPAAPYGTILPFRRVFAVARTEPGQYS
jgi:trans-aconitate 2-methyltransferase